MNYLTSGEMSRIINLMDFLNGQNKPDNLSVSFDVKAYDTNGEPLGTIQCVDATYSFYPEALDG